jgi:antitoxin PrlF
MATRKMPGEAARSRTGNAGGKIQRSSSTIETIAKRPRAASNTDDELPGSSARQKRVRKARFELRSKLTERGQTTLPTGVRQALRIEPGEELAYTVQGEQVIITRVSTDAHRDPLIARFLALLEEDIERNPHKLVLASAALEQRMLKVSGGQRIDPDEPIDGEVAL